MLLSCKVEPRRGVWKARTVFASRRRARYISSLQVQSVEFEWILHLMRRFATEQQMSTPLKIAFQPVSCQQSADRVNIARH